MVVSHDHEGSTSLPWNPRRRGRGNSQETPSAGTWKQASGNWDWPREERPAKRCSQDPLLQLTPHVRAARTYESLSMHETLTTINAFGARVKMTVLTSNCNDPGKGHATSHRWLRTPTKQSQHFNATYRNTVAHYWIEFNISEIQHLKKATSKS